MKSVSDDALKREYYYLKQMGGELGSGFRSMFQSFATDSEFRRAGFQLIDRLTSLLQLNSQKRDQSYYSSYQPDIDFMDETPLTHTHPNVLPEGGNQFSQQQQQQPFSDIQQQQAFGGNQQQAFGGNQQQAFGGNQQQAFGGNQQQQFSGMGTNQSNFQMREISDQEIDEIGGYIDTLMKKSGEEKALGQAFGSLVSMFQHFQHQFYETTHHTESGPKDPTYQKFEELRANPHYKAAKLHLRSLLEHFAGGKSLEGFIHSLKDFIRLTANDEKIRYLQNRLYETFDNLHQSQPQQATEYRQRITSIIKEARHLLQGDERYRYVTSRMFREANEFFRAIERDPVNRKVAEAWQNLADDLFEDAEHTRISAKGLQAFQNVFKHLLITEFQYVPLPRIEFSDEDMAVILDDMVVSSSEILPDKLIFRASTTNKLATNEENRSENLLEVYLDQVRFSMEDFYFWFDKKTFPSMTDEGRADLAVLDQGVKLHLVLRFVASENRGNESGKGPIHIEVRRADFTIDNLRLKVREAKNHQFLLRMLTPFVKGSIRSRMQEGLQSSIYGLVDRVNMYLDSKNPDYMTGMMKQYLL
jgi:hypothetical protein